ncbi:MAG: phospholipase D family protein [Moraxella sp.]|nr:phospholipase D family protein [Moraxella sp.]
MAKFLNTSGTTYHLEELIKNTQDRLILISPYLKLNDRIKELLEDKNRLKIDIRIVYGKSDLQPAEINWLQNLNFVRTSFCKNLHAKCYLNENQCIITSLNLYEFSQINNNEMGVLINRDEDTQLFSDTYEEAQRIIRISDEVRISMDKSDVKSNDFQHENTETSKPTASNNGQEKENNPKTVKNFDTFTNAKLAEKLGVATKELVEVLQQLDYITVDGKLTHLTDKGKQAGGEMKSGKFGLFVVWSINDAVLSDNDSLEDKLKKTLGT